MIDMSSMARRKLWALPSEPPQKRASLRPSSLIAVIIKIANIGNSTGTAINKFLPRKGQKK